MAQIRESRFVCRRINKEDVDLFDLTGTGMVCVETSHNKYDEEIEQKIVQLEEGDIIDAQLQSEDVLQPNSIWRFLEIEVVGHQNEWLI